jgi:hypothetical protein
MFFYALPFYGFSLLTIAVQVFFAVHCIRRGNPGWLFIIVFFPLVGSLVYLFVEYLPEMRARNTVGITAQRVKERLNPAAEIQRLEDQVTLSNSHNNRMELARGYLRAGRADDAISIYRQSLVGMYADDVPLLFELATAYHAVGRLDDARATFEQLRANASMLSNDHLLLGARIFEDAGDLDGAAREYRALLARPVVGEEARCRYALILKQLGRTAEARAIFDEIVRHARLSPGHYRKAQKPWIDTARKELAAEPVAR